MTVESTPMPVVVPASTSKVRRLVAAAALTSLGDGFVAVAFSLLAVRLTARPVLVAGLTVVGALPWLLVSLPVGAIVDRSDRRRLAMYVEGLRAALLGLAVLAVVTHALDIFMLYGVVFLVAVGETATLAIATAVVPLVVGDPGQLPAANGNLQAAETFGQSFAGPALGGFLYAVTASLPLIGDALSFVCSAVLLGKVVPGRAAQEPRARIHLRDDIGSGLRWLLGHRTMRVLTATVASLAFCQLMVFGVLVLYVTRVLHLGSRGYGLILAVAAVGDILGSVLAKRIHAAIGPWRVVLFSALVAAGGYVLLGHTGLIAVAGLAMFAETAATAVGQVAISSLRHRLIPTERFGIAVNAMRMFTMGVAPIGALFGGALAELIGIRTTFVVAGIAQAAFIAVFALPLRKGIRSSLA